MSSSRSESGLKTTYNGIPKLGLNGRLGTERKRSSCLLRYSSAGKRADFVGVPFLPRSRFATSIRATNTLSLRSKRRKNTSPLHGLQRTSFHISDDSRVRYIGSSATRSAISSNSSSKESATNKLRTSWSCHRIPSDRD